MYIIRIHLSLKEVRPTFVCVYDYKGISIYIYIYIYIYSLIYALSLLYCIISYKNSFHTYVDYIQRYIKCTGNQ